MSRSKPDDSAVPHFQMLHTELLPPPVQAMSWIVKEEMQRDFAIVKTSGNVISVAQLREAFKYRDTCRWVLFVYGRNRTEHIVPRSAIHMPDNGDGADPDQRMIAIDQLPADTRSAFLRGAQKPAVADATELWWSEPPQTTFSMDVYARAATDFLRDLRSERPLGAVNRCGLWITLRCVAAIGDESLIKELLARFHSALLYDLRHGAHRFSPHLAAALCAIPATPPGTIACIDVDQPVVTRALRSMFPTDSNFGALPFESIDIVAPLVAKRAILVQAGWLMAPLRLLRPYVLAGRTVQTLRQATKGWLAAAAAATPGNGANQPKLRELGLEMKRLFRASMLADVCVKATNAMFTSSARTATASANLKPPRCAREYMLRAERGDTDAKLVFQARWGMLRLLRGLGCSRFEVERAFLSAKGLVAWYPDPRQREAEARQRKIELTNVFRKPLDGRHVACQTLARYGCCPFQGNVGACCASESGSAADATGVWSPMQVAKLGRAHVQVAVEPTQTEAPALHDNMYIVPELPVRVNYASLTVLQ